MAAPVWDRSAVLQNWEPYTVAWDAGSAGPDRYLLCMAQQDRQSVETITDVSYAGVAMSVLASGTHANLDRDWVLYGLPAPATGSNNFVANGTGTNAFQFTLIPALYTGVHQTNAPSGFVEIDYDTGMSVNHVANVSSAVGDLVVGFFTDLGSNRTVSSYESGVTSRMDNAWQANSRAIVADMPGGASVTIGLTFSGGTDDCGVAFSLPAAEASGQPAARRLGGIRHGRPGGVPGVNVFKRAFEYSRNRRIFLPLHMAAA